MSILYIYIILILIILIIFFHINKSTINYNIIDGTNVSIRLHEFPFDLISLHMKLIGYWEKWMHDIFLDLFSQRKGIILDIGANIGTHSVACSLISSVWAFEPQKKTFDILINNAKQNQKHEIKCFNIGLSDKTGIGKLQQSPLFNNGATKIGKGDGESISLDKLDNIWMNEGMPFISFIKIDIEGHEINALKGAIHTLSDKPPIIFECHTGNNVNYLKKYYDNVKRLKSGYNDFIAYDSQIFLCDKYF